ncbi:hypothetical protein BGX38DRAFT_1179965 [Terfezia claveryi]|nr:hypothetical protein BGX38DRAFT_1179965 [Terfezia claveryi]
MHKKRLDWWKPRPAEIFNSGTHISSSFSNRTPRLQVVVRLQQNLFFEINHDRRRYITISGIRR